jgi:hypothetical protein
MHQSSWITARITILGINTTTVIQYGTIARLIDPFPMFQSMEIYQPCEPQR